VLVLKKSIPPKHAADLFIRQGIGAGETGNLAVLQSHGKEEAFVVDMTLLS
jgi:hypothetical protein